MIRKFLKAFKLAGQVSLAVFLGAQVVGAQNLLVNGAFSAGDSGFSSDYEYIASGQSAVVGTYGVRTNSQDFNPGYTLFNDHTSGSGFMMLVDGANSIGTVAWQETVAVATNQNYAFSGWVASSDGASPAVLRFAVNGIPINSDLALGTDAGVWHQFVLPWNSGTSTSAVITIADENGISLGNDFALDDLSFATYTAVTASIYPAVEIDWNSVTNVNYQVQYSTSLDTNTWLNLGGPVAGNGATNVTFDTTRGQPAKFYRVLTLQ